MTLPARGAFNTTDSGTIRTAEQQSQIFLLAVEHTADAVLVTDRNGTIIYVNAAFEALSGYSRSEIIGQHPSIFRAGQHGPSFYARLDRVLYGGRVFRAIFTSRAKNGDLFWEDKTISPITDAEGEITHFVSIGRNVSEMHEARELESRLRAAEEAERLKTDLLSTISHELRTPLAAMMSYTTAILEYGEGLGPERVTEYLRSIEKRGHQLQELIDHLLTMSRLESGNLPMELEVVSLQDVVFEAIEDRHLSDSLNVEMDLPRQPLYVRIDASRIREVLQNLLENAEKHSAPVGSVVISAEPLDEDWVQVTVRDHGGGVEPEELEAIFRRFYRTKAESTTNQVGAGLGLSICEGIVQAHGGVIRAHLPQDGGLAISFTLPAANYSATFSE